MADAPCYDRASTYVGRYASALFCCSGGALQRRRRIRTLLLSILGATVVAWVISSGASPLPEVPELNSVSAVHPASRPNDTASTLRPRRNAFAGPFSPLPESNFSWRMVNESDALTGISAHRVRLFKSGRMYTIDRARALECLRDRHIVYIGDSHSRASYMNLVHWLHVGGWYSNVPWEDVRLWFPLGGGPVYNQNTTRALRRPDGSSYEFCDCIFASQEQNENRMYRDWRRGLSISFLQARNPPAMRGFWPSFLNPDGCTAPVHFTGDRCVGSRQQGCEAGNCTYLGADMSTLFGKHSIFEYGTSFPLDYFGGNNSVHTIVLSSGAWGALDGNRPSDHTYARIAATYAAGSALAKARGVKRLVWRATMATATGENLCHNESLMYPVLRNASWRVLDFYKATAALQDLRSNAHSANAKFPDGYYDNSHITQPYHRGITEMLLTELLDDCL